MKLKDLKSAIYSLTGAVQLCIVYDYHANIDLHYGCSVEYAYEVFGEREIHRVFPVMENGNVYTVFSII